MDPEESSPILILYYKPTCPYCQKVLAFMDENQVQVPLKNIAGDPKGKEELLHLGGEAQVPCLFIDGTPLYESDDIIEWLKKKKDLIQ